MLTFDPRVSVRVLSPVVLAVFALAVAGCSRNAPPADAGPSARPMAMAPASALPAEVQQAPAVVQAAYRYAVANPDMLKQVGCYCGCGGMGHTSNYSCFVAGHDATGAVVYDGHALGCSICVDIARDVMRLSAEGRDMRSIRTYVDREYSKYGPSNLSE